MYALSKCRLAGVLECSSVVWNDERISWGYEGDVQVCTAYTVPPPNDIGQNQQKSSFIKKSITIYSCEPNSLKFCTCSRRSSAYIYVTRWLQEIEFPLYTASLEGLAILPDLLDALQSIKGRDNIIPTPNPWTVYVTTKYIRTGDSCEDPYMSA